MMPRVDDRQRRRLVLIVGPIAAGKSSLAVEVAQRLRVANETVAVVSLDAIAEMALPVLADWWWAHEVHARTVAAWLATPIGTVVAEGPGSPEEIQLLLSRVPSGSEVIVVLLVSRYPTALARAQAEPTRGISRDPDFLDREYQRFLKALPDIRYDVRLDSEQGAPSVLADQVVEALTRSPRT